MMEMGIGAIRRGVVPAAVPALVLLAGCGAETTGDGSRTPPPPLWETAGIHFAETSVTSLSLVASAEYNSTTSLVDVHARVHDQGSVFVTAPRFNQYNFSITEGDGGDAVDMSRVPCPELIEGREARMYVLAVDSSLSMGSGDFAPTKMEATKAAAYCFAGTAVGMDGTTCAVVDFDDDARLAQRLTSDTAALDSALVGLVPDGAAAIGDALVLAARQIGARPGRGAVVLLTNSAKTGTWSLADALAEVQRFGLPVYAVGIGVSDDSGDPLYNGEIAGQLKAIAGATGGEAFFAPDPAAHLTPALDAILALEPPRHDAYLLHSPLLTYLPGRQVVVNVGVYYRNVNGTHQAMSSADIEIP